MDGITDGSIDGEDEVVGIVVGLTD